MTPTDELKRQWRRAMQYLPLSLVRDMADAFRDALAEVRRLEFEAEHRTTQDRQGFSWGCSSCSYTRVHLGDPRHFYLDADWKQAAEKELSE